MDLNYTRKMVSAAINGDLEEVNYRHDKIFNLDIPLSCPGLPSEILDPSSTWSDNHNYSVAARRLAALFVRNFERFGGPVADLVSAGPSV
jgi:phosphoenolpyruvate carboxykinase (ATP)